MELNYNVTSAERKRLVEAISAYTGAEARYLFAPTFGYEVDCFSIDKDGVVSCGDDVDREHLKGLVDALASQGFTVAITSSDAEIGASTEAGEAMADTADEGTSDNEREVQSVGNRSTVTESAETDIDSAVDRNSTEECGNVEEDAEEEKDAEYEATGLTVSLPTDGFTESSLLNLRKLVDSKAGLIQKALGADRLDIVTTEENVSFPWFDTLPAPEDTQAYTGFIAALCQMAKNARRITATEKSVENEKYAFRCFLLRLGFIGADNKPQRKILLRNLSGSSAFKSGVRKESAAEPELPADGNAEAPAETTTEVNLAAMLIGQAYTAP